MTNAAEEMSIIQKHVANCVDLCKKVNYIKIAGCNKLMQMVWAGIIHITGTTAAVGLETSLAKMAATDFNQGLISCRTR